MSRVVALMVVCASRLTLAGPHDFVIETTGMGGTAEVAAPFVDQFLRHLETVLGWPEKSTAGQFFSDRAGTIGHIESAKPGIGMIEPDLWLDLHKKHALTVVASITGPRQAIGHLSVVVKDLKYKTLGDLKGQVLTSNHLESPRFLSKIVFDGKLDAATFFKLQQTPSPLRGLKAVDRGEAAATLLDDMQTAQLQTLPFASSLRVLYKSEVLPAVPVVAFGKNITPADRDQIAQAMIGVCKSEKGAAVCKALQIEAIVAPDKRIYDSAMRRYNK